MLGEEKTIGLGIIGIYPTVLMLINFNCDARVAQKGFLCAPLKAIPFEFTCV
jgi:hypothetical protein